MRHIALIGLLCSLALPGFGQNYSRFVAGYSYTISGVFCATEKEANDLAEALTHGDTALYESIKDRGTCPNLLTEFRVLELRSVHTSVDATMNVTLVEERPEGTKRYLVDWRKVIDFSKRI